MKMNPHKESAVAVIDNDLFKIYAQYQLCRVKKGITDSDDTSEKKAILQILEACQHISANTFHTLVDDILQHSVQPEALDDGGLTRLFDSTANHRNSTPSLSSCLYKRPKSAAHGEREMVDTDRHFSRGESGTEGSDDEGPTIIRPSKKRAREVSRRHFLSPGSHSNRNGLSDSSLRALNEMSSAPEETKQELFKRMKKITDSFSIDYSISKEGSTPVQSFKIHFSEKFAPQSINYQCQSNFVAYQLGQIIEREAHIFSSKEAEENKKLYYAHCLTVNKGKTKSSEISKYCKTLGRAVNDIGVYCLFMPEVLPPTFFKRAEADVFKRVADYMNEKFPQFDTIASIDENGNLFIADIEDGGEDVGEDVGNDKRQDTEEDAGENAVDYAKQHARDFKQKVACSVNR
ncbi:unnamed protein product [Mucor circinelloides]